MRIVRPVEWVSADGSLSAPGRIRLLDQTRLPNDVVYFETSDVRKIRTAIKTLQVRGAPAIGIAAAMGVAVAVQRRRDKSAAALIRAAVRVAEDLAASRPTAVNLFWALDRMVRTARAGAALSSDALKETLVREALAIRDEDAAQCRAIGRHGAALLRDGDTVLTHCNAGGLATAEFGTALAPIYTAHGEGKRIGVYADETRPLLQGSRLTAWELQQAGVDVTVICDNMTAQVMKEGRIQAVMVGADRIAANGDAANKIGTYGVAVLARAHHIPFYVLAPTTTFDFKTPDGAGIPIEERGRDEIACGFGRKTVPDRVKVYAPAFDVTPARLISAIICEHGIARADYRKSLARLARRPRLSVPGR